ncbi:hypothetical protein ABMA28_015905 [Loxostege sticticalis]|uniref:FP protein C-terminal domain-containing protein n=1 Tax=Loxostege sticticalis TaxID=481309 RepID=A0ABD0TBE9_LOXSC
MQGRSADSEHSVSDPNMRKRKRDEEVTRSEILEMFSLLKKEQDEKFTALMNKVERGINTNTEQYKDITCSIDFLGQKYDDLLKKINVLEEEKSADRKYINFLENRLDQMDRSLRSSCVEIRNVPKNTNGETKEDLRDIVNKVGQALNISFQSTEIRDVYRINTKKENNQPIVAELSSVFTRDKIIASVKNYNKNHQTSKFNTSNLKIAGPPKPVYVSENLTMATKKLFYQSREFAKANCFKYCWTSRGRIYLRRADGAPFIRVNNENDLSNIPKT